MALIRRKGKTILSRKDFFALICDDRKYRSKKEKPDPMLCGVFASKKETQDYKKEIEGCVLDHYIKKCTVTVTYD